MAEDIGENLVGSYLRYVEQCDFIVYNAQYPTVQSEIDVVGMRLSGGHREIWFCEVITHIDGTLYGTYEKTMLKLEAKILRAREFANAMFPDPADHHRFEIWSPVVPVGKLTTQFEEMERRHNDDALDLHFVINGEYTARIQALIDHARTHSAATSDSAYRLLQVLTRLRGTLTV